jgi:SAM-dependent methyltransferase
MPSSVTTPPDDLLAEWAEAAPRGPALELGAGRGETARWLGTLGFTVDAIESDPESFAQLATSLEGTTGRAVLADIRSHPLPRQRYGLVTALAFFHFFHPEELVLLSRRITRTLAPGGFLIASVFTTDDPGLAERRASGETMIAPATFHLSGRGGVIHYFGPGEFARLFRSLQTVEYDEARRLGPDGRLRAGASLVARRPG